MTTAERGEDRSVRSLQRGLQVLDAVLADRGDGVRVVDLCRACGIERATVYRLLGTLVDQGYVASRGRFRYVAGPRAAPLVVAPKPSLIARKLQPVLTRISEACGDASFAVVADGAVSLCVARQIGTWPVQILSVQVGTRQPLGVGAGGLALLSTMEPGEAAEHCAVNEPELARYGGMTRHRLELLTKAARERGWAAVGNHAVRGALGVGIGVRGVEGRPLAGISIAAPIARMPKERQAMLAALMRDTLSSLLPKGI